MTISFPFPVFSLILMDNQNAKLKLKLYVKLLTKFSNMPVKWPFKILLGGDGSVLQHGINGFLQKKNKAFIEFLIFCLITASFQISRQNHTLFWQKNLKNNWEEVEMIWKNISIWYFEPNKIPPRQKEWEMMVPRKQ